MPKLRTLMNSYKKGEITKAQYEAEVAKLLEEDIIDQEQHDDALEYDPEADKPIFTQDDVDRMVAAKAVKMVRKALKDAGVEVDAPNKDLLTKVAEMAKNGTGTEGGKATDQDLEKLKKLEAKVPGLEAKAKDLTIENAVLKAAGGLKPVNPIQVVRALKADYMDLVEIDDETGAVDTKSIDRALKRIATAEPNLFQADDGGDEGGEGGENGGQAGGFKGKGPGGGTGGGKSSDKDLAKKKEEAKAMLRAQGINIPETNK